MIFRWRVREGEKEEEKYQCVIASCTPPTGDLALNPGMCPDWESNWRPLVCRTALNPLSHTRQGLSLYFYWHITRATKFNILNFYNSVHFSIFTRLYNHHHYLIPEHFYHLKKKPELIGRHSSLHSLPLKTNGSIIYTLIFTLMFLPKHPPQRYLIYILVYRVALFLKSLQYSLIWINHIIYLISLWLMGILVVPFSAITNNAVINIPIRDIFYTWNICKINAQKNCQVKSPGHIKFG